jgi:transcriptional regulator with XRE-family HTH domain
MLAEATRRYDRPTHESTGWSDHLFGSLARAGAPAGATAATLAFLVGTGGACTLHYIAERDAKGYRLPTIEWKRCRENESRAPAASRAAQALATIRATLPFSVAELARAFGVSRQAVYLWQRGEPISADHESRLVALAAAAPALASAADRALLRRPIEQGRTFLELVARGANPATLMAQLTSIERTEREERERLAALFAGRATPRVDFDEFGRSYPDDSA